MLNTERVQEYVTALNEICIQKDIWLDSDIYENIANLEPKCLEKLARLETLSDIQDYENKESSLNDHDLEAIKILASLSDYDLSEDELEQLMEG